MKFLIALFFLSFFATAASANAYQCTSENGHKIGVAIELDQRLLTVTHEDGAADRGFFIERTMPDVAYVAYYLPTGYGDPYAFHLWQDGSRAEFEYCAGCGVFTCETSEQE